MAGDVRKNTEALVPPKKVCFRPSWQGQLTHQAQLAWCPGPTKLLRAHRVFVFCLKSEEKELLDERFYMQH